MLALTIAFTVLSAIYVLYFAPVSRDVNMRGE